MHRRPSTKHWPWQNRRRFSCEPRSVFWDPPQPLCCQPTELIWVFCYYFINFPILPPPPWDFLVIYFFHFYYPTHSWIWVIISTRKSNYMFISQVDVLTRFTKVKAQYPCQDLSISFWLEVVHIFKWRSQQSGVSSKLDSMTEDEILTLLQQAGIDDFGRLLLGLHFSSNKRLNFSIHLWKLSIFSRTEVDPYCYYIF